MPKKETVSKKGSMFDSQIHIYRAMQRMTQQELADKVGVSRQTIIHLERNKYNPSLLLAHDIADVFGVFIEEIFKFKTKKDQQNANSVSHAKNQKSINIVTQKGEC